eukprot:scaffold128792_cov51-Phaeocystis_antarctica.AAC.1
MGRRERAQFEACTSLPCRHGRQRRMSAIVRVPGCGGEQASRPCGRQNRRQRVCPRDGRSRALAVGKRRQSPSQTAAAATAARAMTTAAASRGTRARP